MAASTSGKAGKYLTFKLGEETFGINIANIHEVLKLPDVTHIPGTQEYVRGVINVRGSVVPVVDLKRKFGQGISKAGRLSRVIIVESILRDKKTILGALADSVEEVVPLREDQIDPAPEVGVELKSAFVLGIGKHDDQFIILLDIVRIFSVEELIVLEQTRKHSVKTQSGETLEDER